MLHACEFGSTQERGNSCPRLDGPPVSYRRLSRLLLRDDWKINQGQALSIAHRVDSNHADEAARERCETDGAARGHRFGRVREHRLRLGWVGGWPSISGPIVDNFNHESLAIADASPTKPDAAEVLLAWLVRWMPAPHYCAPRLGVHLQRTGPPPQTRREAQLTWPGSQRTKRLDRKPQRRFGAEYLNASWFGTIDEADIKPNADFETTTAWPLSSLLEHSGPQEFYRYKSSKKDTSNHTHATRRKSDPGRMVPKRGGRGIRGEIQENGSNLLLCGE